jgi:hypothetical protein
MLPAFPLAFADIRPPAAGWSPPGLHPRALRSGRATPILILLATGCQKSAQFENERSYLFGIGIPGEFLRGAREIGRADLAWHANVTGRSITTGGTWQAC